MSFLSLKWTSWLYKISVINICVFITVYTTKNTSWGDQGLFQYWTKSYLWLRLHWETGIQLCAFSRQVGSKPKYLLFPLFLPLLLRLWWKVKLVLYPVCTLYKTFDVYAHVYLPSYAFPLCVCVFVCVCAHVHTYAGSPVQYVHLLIHLFPQDSCVSHWIWS